MGVEIDWVREFVADENEANAGGEVTWNIGLCKVPAVVGLGVRGPTILAPPGRS
jgi:hypothetical protein